MNIKEELTCKHCNETYTQPIILNCCGENICKQHIDELVKSSTKFTCPLCSLENENKSFITNKFIQKMVENELHKFEIDPKYKQTLASLRAEIENLEKVLNEPEYFIFNEINELKRQVDLDREKLKSEIDELADDLIQKLESYEKKFKAEYKSVLDNPDRYKDLADSSKKQLVEFEKYFYLFSVKNEERDEKSKEVERMVNVLQPSLKEVKEKIFLNLSLSYSPMEDKIENVYGKLSIRVS